MIGGILKFFLVLIILFLVTLAIGVIARGDELFLYRFFAPREEAARREVFEQSRSYNEGMAQSLRSMQLQYVQADPVHRQAMVSIILHQIAGYDMSKMPQDLQEFVRSLPSR